MIQVYKVGNENYKRNGDATLDVYSCELDMALNGAWELTLEAPIDPEGRWKYIQVDAVIAAPTPIGDKQLFRIYDSDKSMDGVTAQARPIFMDSANDVFFTDTRPTDCVGQTALDWLMRGTKYSGVSDITDVRTAYYVRKNLMEALASDDSNSFLNRWGGEIVFNNYTININRRQGKDRGLRVEFGRNIASIHETVNIEALATRLYPVAFSGRMLDGPAPYVDSPRIGSYPIVYAKVLACEDIKLREDLDGDPSEGDIVCETLEELHAALRARCQEQYDSGVDIPQVTYDVDMVDLSSKAEYADYKALEYVVLGDTVHCKHRKLGIETEARVIQVVYDCARQVNNRLVLGDYQHDYFSRLNDTARKVEVLDQKIDDNTAALSSAITEASRELNEKIANASGMYCTEEVQPDGSIIYLLHDKPTLEASTNVIKLTSEAIGFSTDGGKSFPYGFTVTGEMVAALLTANGVNADWIRLGVLRSRDDAENFYLDLINGVLRMKAAELTIAGKTVDDIVGDAVDTLDDALTQAEVFKRLTNNLANQGIYLEGSRLYINASYIHAGVLDLAYLTLAGTKCGLKQGQGMTGDGRTTQGIVMYGNGLDSDGVANMPYIIVTDAGIRLQTTGSSGSDYNLYLSGGNCGLNGNLAVHKAGILNGDITADGNLNVGGGLVFCGGYLDDYSLWLGQKHSANSVAINAYTSDTSGVNIAGWSYISDAAWVGNGGGGHGLVLHGNDITADVNVRVTSDRSMKKDIEPLESVAPIAFGDPGSEGPSIEGEASAQQDLAAKYEALLDHMTPVRFRYKNESEDEPFHLGYIAQDVEAALAAAGLTQEDLGAVHESIDEKGNRYLGIAYGELIALLHLKLKRQDEEIQNLKNELAAMKADIAALKAAITK